MKPTGKKYDPETDRLVPFTEGVYPAHIVALDKKDLKGDGNLLFDYTFKIAPEAVKVTVKDPETGQNIPARHMVGKKFNMARTKGVWLNPFVGKDDAWKNANYVEFHEKIGIEMPRDKDGAIEIMEVEHEDVLGMPVAIELKWEKAKDGDKKYMKVFSVIPWKRGVRKSPDDILADEAEEQLGPQSDIDSSIDELDDDIPF
jgi:hypothetical protein